jgi:hypothetical protein
LKIHLALKIKRQKELSHKTVDIKVCFTISAGWWKDPDPGGQKTYGSSGFESTTLL